MFVVYNKATSQLVQARTFKTEAASKAALTRSLKENAGLLRTDCAIIPFAEFKKAVHPNAATDFEVINGPKEEFVIPEKPVESDDAIMKRIGERFEMLNEMTRATKRGAVKALIVSGAPGVGKSYGIETVLSQHDTYAAIADSAPTYEIIKGNVSAIALYQKLYEFRDPKNILVFDDCDSVLFDEVSLNLLKAALDSKKNRTISWNTESYILNNAAVPNKFDFNGSVIFITNLKFDHVRSAKLKAHLEAIESRCHYMDLTIDTTHEKMLRIKQVVRNNMLNEYALSADTKEDIIKFVEKNKDKLRELSLRTVVKIADLAVAFPTNWKGYAKTTVMKRS